MASNRQSNITFFLKRKTAPSATGQGKENIADSSPKKSKIVDESSSRVADGFGVNESGMVADSTATPTACSSIDRVDTANAATVAISEADSSKKTKKYTRDLNRKVKAEWFQAFKWLQYDEKRDVFMCEMCCSTKKSNTFTSGKSAARPKRDDFVKHENTRDHKMSNPGELSHQMTKAITNAHNFAKDAIKAQLATVLMQAKEGIPTSKNAVLLELQLFNVSYSPLTIFWTLLT